MTLTTAPRSAPLGALDTASVPLEALVPERGVALLVGDVPVAVFRLDAGVGAPDVVALDHVDPRSGAAVIARGLIGSVGDREVVVAPLHKQRIDLRTGECLDDPALSLRTWSVEVVDGVVHVSGPDVAPTP